MSRFSATLLLAFFWSLLPCAFSPIAAAPVESLDNLVDRARYLSADPQWLAFLHYDHMWLRGDPLSRAQQSKFFLSDIGAKDPMAELESTIRAFAQPIESDDDHPICLFPARYRWIVESLKIPQGIFPKPRCARYMRWFEAVNPHKITLIFPASFLNNPASAFGHTFIRLDRSEQNEETRLLAYAADYSAATHGESALVYAVKGIFGGFDGFYSIMPYAKKVEKYSDLENRDIWEYQLGFSSDEVRRLTEHIWELREAPMSYFYFDENCSYHILSLLDVARPSLELRSELQLWVIPVDTIRVIAAKEGLIEQTIFRPSAATKLRARIAATSDRAQSAAFLLARSSLPVAETSAVIQTPEERADALDLGYDYLTYERIRARSDSSDEKKRAWDLLAARSALPKSAPVRIPTPDTLPQDGHKTGMIALGAGRSEDRTFGEFIFRPAFHGLTDPLPGYLPGNQIKFFESAARLTEDRGLELNRFTALDIFALTPDTRFFHPISWHVNVSYQQFNREGGDAIGLGALTAGGGKTYQIGDHLLAYGMVDGAMEYSSNLQREHAAGLGPRFGAVYLPCQWAATEVSSSYLFLLSGDAHRELSVTLSERFALTKELNLRAEASYNAAFENSGWMSLLRLEKFFTP